MAKAKACDYVIWAKHVSGDPRLVDRILRMRAGETLALVADGVPGIWEKMADQPTGLPTPGIKPVDAMKTVWGGIHRSNPKATVDISMAEPENLASARARVAIEPPLAGSEDERQAAWSAFLALANAGWRSERAYGPRDELYER